MTRDTSSTSAISSSFQASLCLFPQAEISLLTSINEAKTQETGCSGRAWLPFTVPFRNATVCVFICVCAEYKLLGKTCLLGRFCPLVWGSGMMSGIDIYYISYSHSYTLSADVLVLSTSAFLDAFSPFCVLLHFKWKLNYISLLVQKQKNIFPWLLLAF